MLKTFIAIAALISVPATAGAEIYKCRLANGKTEITNAPCPSGSGTVTVRRDEPVSEKSRRQAEKDVERMRNYVDSREAAQRAEEAAERKERAASQQQRDNTSHTPRQYGSAEECLRNLEPMALEASQRARMEADCRSMVSAPPVYVPVPVAVPVYPTQRRHHVEPPPAPKTEPPSAPTISMPPLKK
jgi:hypothetical protein